MILSFFQVKSNIDRHFVVGSQIVTVIVAAGSGTKAIFGPLPYFLVVIMVEIIPPSASADTSAVFF